MFTYLQVKRFFDIVFAALALIMISPVLLLVALAIKIESPNGPVWYVSKRVGQGFRVFDLYKFRSMRPDADQMVQQLKHLSVYENTPEAEAIVHAINPDDEMLMGDDGWVSEGTVMAEQTKAQKTAFVKIQNDPRITRVGHFIRNTSLDELPQIINILIGDMSFVGNRPLPLYEAMQLTTDDAVTRFEAPAGLTGLWQVTERAKAGTGTDSRVRLDNEYARRISFGLDLWILVRTPRAALQQEAV